MNDNNDLLPIQDGPTRQEMISILEEMVQTYSRLPPQAQYQPVTHSDFTYLLMLLSALFKADRDSAS